MGVVFCSEVVPIRCYSNANSDGSTAADTVSEEFMICTRVLVVTSSLSGGAATGMREFLSQIPDAEVEYFTFNIMVRAAIRRFVLYPKLLLIIFWWLYSKIIARDKVTKCFKGLDFCIEYDDYQIIILGNLGNGFVDIERLENSKATIFWRHSDMWGILPGPHYPVKIHPLRHLFIGDMRKKERLILRAINIFPSSWLEQKFKDKNANNFRSQVILNAGRSDMVPSSNSLSVSKDVNVGFCAANLGDRRKRFANFLQLAKGYLNDEGFCFVAIGKSSPCEGYKKRTSRYKNLTFVGHLEKTELRNIYNNLDIFCQFAEFDNSPNASIDALRTGLLLIVVGEGGITDYIADEVKDDVLLLKKYDDGRIRDFISQRVASGALTRINKSRRAMLTHQYLTAKNAAQTKVLEKLWVE